MVTYLGGIRNAGGALKETGTMHWNSPNPATNSTGFTALPGGYRSDYDGDFHYLGQFAWFWTSTVWSTWQAWNYQLPNASTGLGKGANNHEVGASVRCIQD